MPNLNPSLSQPFDSLLFDLDGTLWDSREVVAQARNRVIEELGLEQPSFEAEDVGKTMGLPAIEVYRRSFPSLGDECYAEVRKILDTEMRNKLFEGHARIYPGVRETLLELARSHKLFVVSNCSAPYLRNFLEWSKLEFTDAICFGDTQLPKSSNIRQIVDRHALAHPVYVGDTQGDLDAATQAGIPYIHADYGFGQVAADCPRLPEFARLPEILRLARPDA
jgi:phosphoglycolate phosphatase